MEYIYILTNPAFSGCFKVGKTSEGNLRKRLLQYNVGDPYRQYEFVYLAMVEDAATVEDDVAAHFEAFLTVPGCEWYKSVINSTKSQQSLLKQLICYIESSDQFIRNII